MNKFRVGQKVRVKKSVKAGDVIYEKYGQQINERVYSIISDKTFVISKDTIDLLLPPNTYYLDYDSIEMKGLEYTWDEDVLELAKLDNLGVLKIL